MDEAFSWTFFFTAMHLQLDLDPDCLLAMSLILYAFPKEKPPSLFPCDIYAFLSSVEAKNRQSISQMNFFLNK